MISKLFLKVANPYTSLNTNTKLIQTPNLNSQKQDSVSFKMSYGNHTEEKKEEPPVVTDTTCSINMGRVTHIFPKDNSKLAQDKDLTLNVASSLYLDQIPHESNRINSLLMKDDSSIHNYARVLQVKNQAIINDNCRLEGSSIIFNGLTEIGTNCNIETRDVIFSRGTSIGDRFKTNIIKGSGDISIGNNCSVDSIETKGSINIGNNAEIGNIKTEEPIIVGNNFTPTSEDTIIESNSNIKIGKNVNQIALQGKASSLERLSKIDEIKTPQAVFLDEQNTLAINTINAGNIVVNGNATVNRVVLNNAITPGVSVSKDAQKAILTVLQDLYIPESSDSDKEVTIKNTVIDEDLIIDKDSGVTKLNLENVKVNGKLVLENPNVVVTTDSDTQINKTISGES